MSKPSIVETAREKFADPVKQSEPRQAATPAPETIRIESVKIAAELRTTVQPIGTLIKNAREIEDYITGLPSEAPTGAQAGD
jgi:hypothetical protein